MNCDYANTFISSGVQNCIIETAKLLFFTKVD